MNYGKQSINFCFYDITVDKSLDKVVYVSNFTALSEQVAMLRI